MQASIDIGETAVTGRFPAYPENKRLHRLTAGESLFLLTEI